MNKHSDAEDALRYSVEYLKIEKLYKRRVFLRRLRTFTLFLWKNAITILTFLIAVLTISYGVAIQIFKTLYPDA